MGETMQCKSHDFLAEAYEILFSEKPGRWEQWQVAQQFVRNFNGQKFADDARKECIACGALAFVLAYVTFPIPVDSGDILRRAAGFLAELDSSTDSDMNDGFALHLLGQYEEQLAALESGD